jgi:AraC-like DNA-binding protein
VILVALKMVDPLSNKIKHIIHPELNIFSCFCVYTSNLTASMNQGNPSDQIFITKLTEIIQSNLEKENFGVNELARASGMTSSSLRRKLSSVSEKSINQLIREVRLQKAIEILQQQNATASEVAYKVGFGSPAYFNKCFHDFFGYPPGEVKKRRLNGIEPWIVRYDKILIYLLRTS